MPWARSASLSDAALAARTLGDLAGLTADLPASRTATSGELAIPEEITAVLGNETRKGRWVVPPRMNVRSVLGDCHLEMQQAVIDQQVTTINARVRLGSVTIWVPDGVDVRLTGRAVLGAKSSEVDSAAEPGAPPFVDTGQPVKKGQVLCIIEAMKLMNEINAECDGEIVKVYVENGQAVQYGERLFAIRPS